MNLITVAYYTAIRNFKDFRMLIILLAMPIVLIVILGTALGSFFEAPELKPVNVAFLNEDLGPAGEALAQYFQHEQVAKLIILVEVTTQSDGVALIEDGKVESFVHLPSDFSSSSQPRINLSTAQKYPLVLSFLDAYKNMINLQAMPNVSPASQAKNYVTDTDISREGRVPRAIDYFAVQTLLQVMLMGGWYGIGSVQDDSQYNTGVRLKTAPLSNLANLGGKVLANVSVISVQAFAVVIFSKYVYSVNWNGNPLIIAATLLLFSSMTVALGMLFGRLCKDSGLALGLLWCTTMALSVLAGAFGKGPIFGSSATGLTAVFTLLSPNYYAKNVLFGTIYGAPTQMITSSLLALLLMTAATFGLALVAGRRNLS